MSEAQIEVEVLFKDSSTREQVKQFLECYGASEPQAEPFAREKALLRELGLQPGRLIDSVGSDSEVSEVALQEDGSLRFQVHGGVHGGTIWYEKLQQLLIELSPTSLYSVRYNSQVGEYTLAAYDGSKLGGYETTEDEDLYEELHEALSTQDPVSVLKRYQRNGELAFRPKEPEEEDEDEILLNIRAIREHEQFMSALKSIVIQGLSSGLVLWLLSWVLLSSFWRAKVIGLGFALVYVVLRTHVLIKAKKESRTR